MTKRAKKTAAEFMAELQVDAEFRRKAKERERKSAAKEMAYKMSEQPILRSLAAVGADVLDLMELPTYGVSREVATVLVEGLPRAEDEWLQETIVRVLAAAREPFEGQALVDLFERTDSETLKWTIANTLAEARPSGISDWVVDAMRDRASGKAREMLAIALARLVPPSIAIPVLVGAFDEYPGHVAMALGEVAGPSERELLERAMAGAKGWTHKEIKKAIRAITKRSSSVENRGSKERTKLRSRPGK